MDNGHFIEDTVMTNTEIKARAQDWRRQQEIALELSGQAGQVLNQEDTYFFVKHGLLKMRFEEQSASAVLIFYERNDLCGPKLCRYTLLLIAKPDAIILKNILAEVCGVAAVVRKTRILYMVDRCRIHFDQVDNLGRFIEIELVHGNLDSGNSEIMSVEEIMLRLDIRQEDLIEGSYADLL